MRPRASLVERNRNRRDDVHAEIDGLSQPVGFILFISHGVVDCLECYVFEDYPEDAALGRAFYLAGMPAREASGRDRELPEEVYPQPHDQKRAGDESP